MPDEMDRAQELAEQHLRQSLLRHLEGAAAPPPPANPAARPRVEGACIDCGAAIPQERRTAQPSARRCIECQAEVERSHGR